MPQLHLCDEGKGKYEKHMAGHNVPKVYKCYEKSCEFTGNSKQDLDKHTGEKHITFANGRKKKKNRNIGSNINSSISMGPELHMAKVFATKYSTDMTEADVKADLDEMLKIRTGKIHWIKVTELETYFKTHNSFLITFMVPDSSVFMDKGVWPDGVVYDWYQPQRLYNSPGNGSGTNYH